MSIYDEQVVPVKLACFIMALAVKRQQKPLPKDRTSLAPEWDEAEWDEVVQTIQVEDLCINP